MIERQHSLQQTDDIGWRRVSLAEVATIDRDTVQPDDLDGTELYVGLEHIRSEGTFERVATAAEADLKSNKFVFTKNHLLYGKLRPYLGKIAAPDFGGICSTDILPIRPSARLDRRYLLHYLRTPRMVAHAANGAVGINLPRLSPKFLASFEIPLPPVEDQRRIAAVLDAAAALRARRWQAIAKLDSLTQAAFIDRFGDPGRNSRWPTASLGQICKAKGEYGANVPSRAFDGSRPRYLRITDIREDGTLIEDAVAPGGTEQEWRSKSLYPGDICFARSGSVGKTFLMREEYAPLVFAGYLIRFVPDPSKVHPEYLFSYSRTQHYWAWIRRTATTVAQPNVNARRYAQLELPLPPLDMQRQFADAAERIRHRGRILRTSADLLDTLFASLQQRAFRGEL